MRRANFDTERDPIVKAVQDAKEGAIETRTAAEWYSVLEDHVEKNRRANETFEQAFSRLTLKGHAALLMKAQTLARRYARTGELPGLRGVTTPALGELRKSREELIRKRETTQERVDLYIEELMAEDPSLSYQQGFAKAWSHGSPVLSDIASIRELDAQIRRKELEARA